MNTSSPPVRGAHVAHRAFTFIVMGLLAACSDTPLQPTAPSFSLAGSGASHYEFVNGGYTWAAAKAAAEAQGGHLAIITSAGEQAQLIELATGNGLAANQYWIGGYHPGDGSAVCGWYWLDGAPIPVDRAGTCFNDGYSNWHPVNPSGDLHGMSFLWYPWDEGQRGQWNDAPETYSFGYVVEFEAAQVLENLATTVTSLLSSGAIPATAAAPLRASLDAVGKALQNGNTQAALGALGAFDNKVDALLKSGKITADTAAEFAFLSALVRAAL